MSNREWTDDDYRDQARRDFQEGGEIDDGAVVSRNESSTGSQGAYVAAWVWVDSADGEEVQPDELLS